MKHSWHVATGENSHGVFREDGVLYARCFNEIFAQEIATALNAKESQVNRGAYPEVKP